MIDAEDVLTYVIVSAYFEYEVFVLSQHLHSRAKWPVML